MFCNNCGTQLPDGQYTCNVCGAYVGSVQQPQQNMYGQQQGMYNQPQQNVYGQQPQMNMYNQPQQNVYGQPQMNVYNQNTYKPELGMKWFKFLTNFMLFLTCILNLLSGYLIFTGNQYKEGGYDYTNLMYRTYDGLQTIDIIVGILLLVLGVYAIVVRFMLVRFKKIAPLMFLGIYGLAILINCIYAGSVSSITGLGFTDIYSPASLAGSIFMICVNWVYFNNRKHLFVN